MARKQTEAEAMFEAFQRFLDARNTPITGAVPESLKKATGTRKSTRSSGKSATTLNKQRKPKSSTPSRTTAKGVVTCQQAWEALGADPQFKPSDPNAPARNGQLWALNVAGKIRLV